MENKIIYPIIIIIFSILIIFAILNRKRNNKLNNNIEKFVNSIPNVNNASNETVIKNKVDFLKELKLNTANNSLITVDFANGNWTTPWTTTNIDYRANYLMNIKVNSLMNKNPKKSSYGNIEIPIGYNRTETYNIIFILNENIVAVLNANNNINLHIKFYNIFTEEGPFMNSNTLTSLVTIYSKNTVYKKFYSYKVSGDILSNDLYNIINNKNSTIAIQPPEIYDITTYKTIIGNYKFATNAIQLTFGITNNNIYNTINSNYGGNIIFTVQRTYNSITKNEITTKMSNKITITAIQPNNQIPSNILISSFQSDIQANGLESTFKPVGTSLYFYKLIQVDTSYDYSNSQLTTVSSDVFSLQNNATNMYQSNVQFNDLNSVQQINDSIYQVTLVGYYTVNKITDTVTVPFSVMYNLL